MSRERRSKGRLPPFVPVLKDTMKAGAWKALSHGARSLYIALKSRYNNKLQGAVYLSSRGARQELGRHSHRTSVLRWFRELQYYGFIVMVSPAHHGLNGHGKAAHYRLTEEWYLGKAPTRDFLNWDGSKFQERKSPKHYQRKNKARGTDRCTTPVQTGVPVAAQSEPEMKESGTDWCTISEHSNGTDGGSITSLTTPCLTPAPDSLDIPAFLDRRAELSA